MRDVCKPRLLPLATSLSHLNTQIWAIAILSRSSKGFEQFASECAAAVLIAFTHGVLTLDAAATRHFEYVYITQKPTIYQTSWGSFHVFFFYSKPDIFDTKPTKNVKIIYFICTKLFI